MFKLRFCENCKKYTLKQNCPNCEKKTRTPHPAKYSPEDRWAKYRRQAKFGKGV